MDLIYKKDPSSDSIESFWQKEFYVEAHRVCIKYNYILFGEEDKKGFWEREHLRTIYLNDPKDETFVKKFSASKREKNFNDLVSSSFKNNVYKIYDFDFNYNFAIDDINENIIIGIFLILFSNNYFYLL